jgi:hypothetical protein
VSRGYCDHLRLMPLVNRAACTRCRARVCVRLPAVRSVRFPVELALMQQVWVVRCGVEWLTCAARLGVPAHGEAR